MKNKLREVRKAAGLTQKEVSEALNIPQNTLSNYENGKRKASQVVWQVLADYFDVSTSYLQGFSDIDLKKVSETYEEYMHIMNLFFSNNDNSEQDVLLYEKALDCANKFLSMSDKIDPMNSYVIFEDINHINLSNKTAITEKDKTLIAIHKKILNNLIEQSEKYKISHDNDLRALLQMDNVKDITDYISKMSYADTQILLDEVKNDKFPNEESLMLLAGLRNVYANVSTHSRETIYKATRDDFSKFVNFQFKISDENMLISDDELLKKHKYGYKLAYFLEVILNNLSNVDESLAFKLADTLSSIVTNDFFVPDDVKKFKELINKNNVNND